MNWDKINKEFEQLCLERWPQTKGEMYGLIDHFDRTGATITAEQLRLTVEMASQRFDQIMSRRN